MLGCKAIVTYKRKRLTGGSGNPRGSGCQSPVSAPKDELIETINSLHGCEDRGLRGSFVEDRDSVLSQSTQKRSRVEAAEKNIEESNEGTSKRDNCLSNKSSSSHTADCLCDDTAMTYVYAGLKPTFESKSCFESSDTPSTATTSINKISDSSGATTKWREPLITFVRRRKRERDIEDDDETGDKRSNTLPREICCSMADVTGLKKLPTEACKRSDSSCQTQEVNSVCARAVPVQDATILIPDGEEVINGPNASKIVLHEDGKVLDLNDPIRVDIEETNSRGISLNNANTSDREESQAMLNDGLKSIVKGSRTILDLSLTPTGSSGILEGNNVLFEPNPHQQSVHAFADTIQGSMDSTSKSHTMASHRDFLPLMSNIRSEGLWESTSTLHLYPGKESDPVHDGSNKASPIPLDLMPKRKCLPLFSEEKTEDNFKSEFMPHEVTTCLTTEEIRSLRFEVESNSSKQRSPPFLGLSLPTRPKACSSDSNKRFTTFPFLSCSIGEIARPLPSRFSSFVRHKSSMHVERALSGKGIFQENLRPYASTWTEEELDSLWIGVRRYGRDNWNAMIKDPRFRFSSWRVASDLAEQWEEEQSKLVQGKSASQGISAGVSEYTATVTGTWRDPKVEETRLSLGDVYASKRRNISRRARFKSNNPQGMNNPVRDLYPGSHGNAFNSFGDNTMLRNYTSSASFPTTFAATGGNLPQWLREAVFTLPPPLTHGQPAESTKMTNTALPRHETGNAFGGLREKDVIVIESDASSEETISDDCCVRS